MKKFDSKKIFKLFSIVLVSICIFSLFSSCVFAQINPDTNKTAQDLAKGFSDFVNNLGGFAANSMFSGLASLLTTLAVVLYLLLALLFSGGTGSIFPAPDNIIFNKIAILDINFFNPNQNSMILGGNGVQNVVGQIYNTFQTIALSVFIIAAMIVGIKLALSSIAQEKAQCKKAITNWVIGIILLFLMRLILAAIFELNEYIVYELSTTVEKVDFDVNIIESIPFIGSALNGIVGFISSVFTGDTNAASKVTSFTSPGYGGFLLKYAGKAIGGDLLSAILLFVLMGQTITLLVSYGKRCVYVIILGVMAPLIVAVDTIGKSYKGQSTVLANWFKEIVLIVFTQTFHAMIMVITLNLISAIDKDQNSSGLSAIAAIILTAGIVKFEKLYRQLFGISDSMLGNLQGQAGKVMAGIHGAMQAGKALADNGKKYKEASQKRKTAIESRQRALTTQREIATDQNRFNTRDITTTAANMFSAAMVEKDPAAKYAKLSKANAIIMEGKAKGYDIPDWVANPIAQQLGISGGGARRAGGGTSGGASPIAGPANGGQRTSYAGGSTSTGAAGGPLGGKSPIRQNVNVAESFDGSSLGSDYFTSNSVTSTYNQNNQQVVQVTAGEFSQTSGNDKRKHSSSNPTVNAGGNASGGASSEKIGNDTFSGGNPGHTTNTVAENAYNDSKDNSATQIVAEMKEMLEQMKHEERVEKSNRSYDNKYKEQQTKLKEAEKSIQQAQKEMGAAALASFMGPANLAAGIGVGLGSGENLSDSMLKGGYTTAGLDKAAEKIGAAVAGSIGKTVRDTLRQSDRRSSVDSI